MALVAGPSGCSDDEETSEPSPTTSTSSSTTSTIDVGGGGSGATGGSGGSGGWVFTCPEGGFAPAPLTPEQIDFEAVNPIPAGEQILFNTWDYPRDGLYSLAVDGSSVTEIFRVFRIWSLGAANGGDVLAFSCGDPLQQEHYGITVGDAIQHSWLYDFASESLTLVSDGWINDECHQFSADDSSLYVCRRYDFACDPEWYSVNKGWRIGRIDLATLEFEFVTDPVDVPGQFPRELDLYPQPNADESAMLFSRITQDPPDQSWAIMQTTLPAGTPATLRDNASAPLRSPDGLRYVYADYDADGYLYSSDLDGQNELLIVEAQATGVRFSPDGTRLVYLRNDSQANCSHIETVAVDGSEAQSPTRIRDCAESGEFITDLAWIVRP